MSSITVFFRNIMHPRLYTVKAVLYCNGKEVNISSYPDIYQMAILKSINSLWDVPDHATFWFEAEIVQVCGCFKRVPPTVYVSCYKEDLVKANFKSKHDIPVRYRTKMFNKLHTIKPEYVGMKSWCENMQVKFIIPDK
jgi:hypothetical protein